MEVVLEGCGGEGELGVEVAQAGRLLVEVCGHGDDGPQSVRLFVRKKVNTVDACVT